jgi:hypothetical protein
VSGNEAWFKVLHITQDFQTDKPDRFVLSGQLNTSVGYVALSIPLTDEEIRELKDLAERITGRVRQAIKEAL